MPAWLALVLLGALTIGYCVAWVIVDRFILSYRPLGPDREWIKGHRVSHYLPIGGSSDFRWGWVMCGAAW